jgi:hypothetical protein
MPLLALDLNQRSSDPVISPPETRRWALVGLAKRVVELPDTFEPGGKGNFGQWHLGVSDHSFGGLNA